MAIIQLVPTRSVWKIFCPQKPTSWSQGKPTTKGGKIVHAKKHSTEGSVDGDVWERLQEQDDETIITGVFDWIVDSAEKGRNKAH